jgi:hypothetical protein
MPALPLLFAGACARVVDEDSAQGGRRDSNTLRSLPGANGHPIAAVPVGTRVQVLYGPRTGQTAQGATTWWVVRLLTGEHRDRVGWMAEMEPGTASYTLREVPCSPESLL